MAEEIAIKNETFPTLKGSWPWPWPWTGSYCIPSCIIHRHLPTRRISLKSKKPFVDRRTYVHTDGRTFETHFIRSIQKVDLKKLKATVQFSRYETDPPNSTPLLFPMHIKLFAPSLKLPATFSLKLNCTH